jgi:diacylglycerol kinase (ATP)
MPEIDEKIKQMPAKYLKYHILKSPYYAFQGIKVAFQREPNLTLQIFIGTVFGIIGTVNGRFVTAMANLIFMGLVLSLELVNTAIETLCDLVHPQYSEKVKIIKDMAAGAVLIVSVLWLVVIVYLVWAILFLKNSNLDLTFR